MHVSVTFRNLGSSDAIRDHAMEKVARLAKYFEEPAEAHILLSTEKILFKAEVNIQAHGLIIAGKESSTDMYNSIDRALEKIEKQIKRYKDRLLKARTKEGPKLKMRFKLLESASADISELAPDLPPSIIETNEFQVKPMMMDEALMQMDLLNNDILVFLNPKTDHVSVLYRKKGNKYGLIETNHG